ncbi:beta-galactosidase [candidate division KSB1 bacterium]|nr:beta-galactosidase [candidate division KSB1 bacterium]
MRAHLLLLILAFFTIRTASLAITYTIDARIAPKPMMAGHLKMGNPGPTDREIALNNQYMSIGGEPVIPVMGEVHFSRIPVEQWEDVILKMKANGITIIASYIFWIHHEQIEGQFDWSGNKDVRRFITLCKKHNLYVYPRIGPWCHGEVRNGGTPDWIFQKKNIINRENHPVYQIYVDRLYEQIAKQLNGLLYKDGGPVIGVQLENEYCRGENGEAHIRWLKQTAQKYGIDVPMYTVTGWRDASVPQDEVIPLWGSYPAKPWARHINKIAENRSFEFSRPMNDVTIGNDQTLGSENYKVDYMRYPYLTCELGVGNQLSEHRRPIINRFDGLAIATINVGSGSNLPGYYVFAGGINPVGVYTTMEENQDETGYWNEYPDISYDFQAAIRETGEIAPSYHEVKKLHYFLKEFGSQLAPMRPVIPEHINAQIDLQYAVRVNGNAGFLFGANYYHGTRKQTQKNVQFEIQFPDELLKFPQQAIDIPDSCIYIWPINFQIDRILLKYATAQPLCRIEHADRVDWFFIQNRGVSPEFCFAPAGIKSIESTSGKIEKQSDRYIVSKMEPGIERPIEITNTQDEKQRIVVLSYEQSAHMWLLDIDGEKSLFLSNSNMYINDGKIHLYGPYPSITLTSLGGNADIITDATPVQIGGYASYQFDLPQKDVNITLRKRSLFEDAQTISASLEMVDNRKQLFHKMVIKEFSAGNPSPIKAATLYVFPEIPCNLRVNSRWVNQPIASGKLNQLDLTGYVVNGNNTLLVDFPYISGEYGFVAKLEIDYFNSDQIEIFTDQSWLTKEKDIIPAPWANVSDLSVSKVLGRSFDDLNFPSHEWLATVPQHPLTGSNHLYLHVSYIGDKSRCRLGYRLISDNFNNGTPWLIELSRFGAQIEGQQLEFELKPLPANAPIYFERAPKPDEINKVSITNIAVVPEYSIDLALKK